MILSSGSEFMISVLAVTLTKSFRIIKERLCSREKMRGEGSAVKRDLERKENGGENERRNESDGRWPISAVKIMISVNNKPRYNAGL